MTRKIDWIESGGGPLLFAPQSSLKDWLGATGSKVSNMQTDYDRACAIEDEIGIISIGTRSAVILGDEPDRTALIAERSGADIFMIRWRWAKSEESMLSALFSGGAIQRLSFTSISSMAISAETYLLFDSACCGTQVDKHLDVLLQAGSYSVETAAFRPNSGMNALIHRMRLHLKVV